MTYAISVMKKGGYLLIDELENRFNKEIVSKIIRFFVDFKLNKNGIIVQNLADILKKNDISKV